MSSTPETPRILVVDPDAALCRFVKSTVEAMGCEVVTTHTADHAFRLLRERHHDLVIAGLDTAGLSRGEGIAKMLEIDSGTVCVAVSGEGGTEQAVQAIKDGAFDCLVKPVIVNALRRSTENALAYSRVLREKTLLQRVVDQRPPEAPIIAESAEMRRTVALAKRLAPLTSAVLITGETGSGKGLMARYLHACGPRAGRPLIEVNCGAVVEQLVESELFGHEAGAFTGAQSRRLGLFEAAHASSLFLDEIAELAPASQAKLLQVLDTGEIRRVGGNDVRRVDARVIAATNRDLDGEVAAGRFRQDLLFRLKVLEIRVPPLRNRPKDIDGLIEMYLGRFARSVGEPRRISAGARRLLHGYSWPGNVRELASVLERACVLSVGEEIPEEALEVVLRGSGSAARGGSEEPLSLRDVERRHIGEILDRTAGNRAKAARLLEIDVKTLRRKIRQYGLE